MQVCMTLEKQLKEKLIAVREARGLSKLAEIAGIEQANLSRALGKHPQQLGLDKVSKLLEALGAVVTFPGDPVIHEPVTPIVEDRRQHQLDLLAKNVDMLNMVIASKDETINSLKMVIAQLQSAPSKEYHLKENEPERQILREKLSSKKGDTPDPQDK